MEENIFLTNEEENLDNLETSFFSGKHFGNFSLCSHRTPCGPVHKANSNVCGALGLGKRLADGLVCVRYGKSGLGPGFEAYPIVTLKERIEPCT